MQPLNSAQPVTPISDEKSTKSSFEDTEIIRLKNMEIPFIKGSFGKGLRTHFYASEEVKKLLD